MLFPRLPLLASVQLALLQLPPFARGEEDQDEYKVVSQRTCEGHQSEYGHCSDLPSCPALCNKDNTKDCEWGEWSNWANPGGCAGICTRQRAYKTQNNACGKPCEGVKMETQKCGKEGHGTELDKSCIRDVQDCHVSEWEEWTSCGTSDLDQKTRARAIKSHSTNGGKSCGSAALRETKPCGKPPQPENCKLSDWTAWSKCSGEYGHGLTSRTREIKNVLQHDGLACNASTSEQKVCKNAASAQKQDCKVADWGNWGQCSEWFQQKRIREVTEAADGGATCGPQNVSEVRACDYTPPLDCVLGEWTKWEKCDKTCDGGQKLRTRTLKTPPSHGGNCSGSLSETAPCGTERCMSKGESDCTLKEWDEWSDCSSKCGNGVKTRSRKGLNPMQNKGRACKDTMTEMATCKGSGAFASKDGDCLAQNCTWNDWDTWEPCSVTCGGGFTRRSRTLESTPRFGGAQCIANNASEVRPCHTFQCSSENCTDGKWLGWSSWGACNTKCGSGYKTRTREPDGKNMANYCGWPAVGSKQEFESCTGSLGECETDVDCELSIWSEWGACGPACFGMKNRSRNIKQYATANGKPCKDDALREMEPCNPGAGEKAPIGCTANGVTPKRDCKLSDWAPWQPCTVKCNGGQKIRTRSIVSPPQNGGKMCNASLEETTECGMTPCEDTHCVDCAVSKWTPWGACSQSGQTERSREVTTSPNFCGKKCESKVLSELKSCSFSEAEARYCAWGAWTSYSSCPSSCSETRKRRSRTLGMMLKADSKDYLFKVSGSSQTACFGTQYNSAACDMSKCDALCKPVNCKLGDWNDWSVPMGYGLCKRSRHIETPNNECGKACFKHDTTIEETKACPVNNDAIDCILSGWSEWSHCESPESTRYRMRHVKNDPRNGGKVCNADLKDAQSCYFTLKPVACEFSTWSEWGSCSTEGSPFRANNKTCGQGYHKRDRRIKTQSKAGGDACKGSLSQVEHCQGDKCRSTDTKDCKWATWGDWSDCEVSLQKYRTRAFEQAKSHGIPCHGEVEQIEGCAPEAVNCTLTEWSSWSKCSSDCRGGTRSRDREIKHKNKHAGKVCAASPLSQTESCNNDVACPNEKACTYHEWSAWTNCSVTCGYAGQEVRSRTVKDLRKVDGDGCLGNVTETRACADLERCDVTDCKWNDWAPWTKCTKKCGGGQKTRTRNLAVATIGEGAKACDLSDMRQTVPCNDGPDDACPEVKCVDGSWDEWSVWEACSATCGDGVTWRRRVIKKEANYCGKPVSGESQQIASCKSVAKCPKDVDCEFGDWNEWTSCSATCDGIKRRIRHVKTRAVGNGKACGCSGDECDKTSTRGAKQETAPCNPANYARDCPVFGIPVNCEHSAWSDWSQCAVTCGSSQRERSRTVVVESRNGGKACEPMVHQTGPCKIDKCPIGEGLIIQDCTWKDWEEWGACDQCDGLMYRGRSVDRHAQYGGKNCTGKNSQEMKTCDKSCFDDVHCTWSSWGEWSDCSISCLPEVVKDSKLAGKRTRKRSLKVVKRPKSEDSKDGKDSKLLYEAHATNEDEVQELYRRYQQADSRRWQEVSAAFAIGCLSFLVGFGVISRCERPADAFRRPAMSRELLSRAQDQDVTMEFRAVDGRRQAMI